VRIALAACFGPASLIGFLHFSIARGPEVTGAAPIVVAPLAPSLPIISVLPNIPEELLLLE
jgi:hypothetical protein